MTDKKYPEEIYETRDGLAMTLKQRDGFGGAARRRAYDLGYTHGRFMSHHEDPLALWANLTEAIQAGERIDWERLDGVEAKCVHPELGTLTHKMERDAQCPTDDYTGWYTEARPDGWSEVFFCSWKDTGGWSLYIKGDLPLRKQTADQLEPGTCFRARYKKGAYTHTYSRAQTVQVEGGLRVLCFNEHFTHIVGRYKPAEVEVLEVYGPGTFQTPEGDA